MATGVALGNFLRSVIVQLSMGMYKTKGSLKEGCRLNLQ